MAIYGTLIGVIFRQTVLKQFLSGKNAAGVANKMCQYLEFG